MSVPQRNPCEDLVPIVVVSEVTENHWDVRTCWEVFNSLGTYFRKKLWNPAVLLGFLSAWYNMRRGNLNWEKASIRVACRQVCGEFSLWGIFLVIGWCGRAQRTVSDAIPEHVAVDCLRKQAGWATHVEKASKQHSAMASVPVPASGFLPVLMDCELKAEINPFLP